MSTKIGSHRIDAKAITKAHLADDVKFSEGNGVTLNYPSHSNQYDLGRDQYLTLTQMGFADHLHKHAGGGGGDAGIYTNKQRDSMLLDLMMLVSSQSYRLENSLIDEFDDTSGIFLGMLPPIVMSVEELTSSSDNKSLEPKTKYAYRISQKSNGKLTDACLPVQTTTSDISVAPYRKIRLRMKLDPRNEGVKVWRAKATEALLAIPFTSTTKLIGTSPIPYAVIPGGNPSGGNSLMLEYIASGGTYKDMGSENYGATYVGVELGKSYNLSLDENFICGFRNSNSRYEIHELNVGFGSNPAEIPTAFDIYYTDSTMPDMTTTENWLPLNCKFKSTDQTGTLVGNKITNNKNAVVSVLFDRIGVTAIKLVIKSHLGAFKLTGIRAIHKTHHGGDCMIQNIPSGTFDMTKAKSLIVDVKADENHNRYGIGFGDVTDNINTVYDTMPILPFATSGYWSTNITSVPGRAIRFAFPITQVPDGYNRIKLTIASNQAWDTEIDNVTIAFTDVNSSAKIAYPETITPVSFNGGRAAGKPDANHMIISDWIELPPIITKSTVAVVTMRTVKGHIYVYNSGTAYIFYKDNEPEALYDATGGRYLGWYTGSYVICATIEIGKSFRSLPLAALPTKNQSKWFRHYIDISAVKANYKSLNKIMYALTLIQKNAQVSFSNVRFSDAERYTEVKRAQIVATATTGVTAGGWDNNLTTSWSSTKVPTIIDHERFMLKFPEIKSIDTIRFCEMEDNATFAHEQYLIQTTVDNTAVVSDPTESPKWVTISSLKYALDQQQHLLAGQIVDGLVVGAGIYSEYITHIFEATDALAIRFVFKKTKGNTAAALRNVEIYTAETPLNYELMLDTNEVEPETFEFIDEEISGTASNPNLINQTGSDNIIYDSSLELVKVFDKTRGAIFVSNVVTTDNFSKVLLRTQVVDVDSSMGYFVSNDGGDTFVQVTLGDVVQMPTIGNKFVLKVLMHGNDMFSAYSLLYTL